MSASPDTADIRRAGFALALLSLLWGYNWIAMKVSLDYATPVASAAARFALAAACLAPAARSMGHSLLVPRGEWRYVAILSTLLAANFAFTLTALKLGGVGKTAVLTYTMPFWVIVIARVWLKENALARLPAGLAGLGTLATPVIGVVAAWIHFGERPSAQDATGMLLIAVALALLALPGARR